MITVISFVYVSVHEEAAWLTRFPSNLTILISCIKLTRLQRSNKLFRS